MKILNASNFKNVKILSLTHKDTDGVGASIVLGNIFPKENIRYRTATYSNVDTVMQSLKYDLYDFVIMTDISPQNPELIEAARDKLILLDHHESAIEYHNPKKQRAVVTKDCATILVKKYCEKTFNYDLSYLDDFCYLVNDYDMWYLKDKRSWELNELFFHYWDIKFRQRFFSGDINFNEEEKKYIKERKQFFNNIWKNLEVFTIDDLDEVTGCFIQEDNMINDLCHTLINKKGMDIVFCRNPKTKSVSIRCKDTFPLHIGNVLRELKVGGGHKTAAGMNSLPIDKVDVVLKQTIDYINLKIKVNNGEII